MTVSVLTALTALGFDASAASIAYGAGKVGASALNVRAEADTSAAVTTMLNEDDIVVILDGIGGEWYHINHEGAVGYVAAMYVTEIETAKNFKATGTLDGSDILMRAEPSTASDALGTYQSGTVMQVIGINSGWYKVEYGGRTGYIRSDLMSITGGESAAPPLGQVIADYAYQYVGYPYVYGGASPSAGFDCSGLIWYTYGKFGYTISRTARQQYQNNGYSVSKDELMPGDLVFFSSNGGHSITHVGLYYGNGMFVNASTPRVGVIFSDLNSAYYTKVYYGAKRIVS